jgi:hypothetical protein
MKKILFFLFPFFVLITACKKTAVDPNVINPDLTTNLSKDIEQDRVLKNTDAAIDYVLTEIIAVEAKLTIEPGVVIVAKAGTGIIFSPKGSIVAIGTADKPIILRSESNLKGGWLGIKFSSSNNPVNELTYVTISDGGSASFNGDATEKANIRLEGASQIKMKNSTVNNSAGFGILETKFDNATFNEFTANAFTNNTNFPIYIADKNAHKIGNTSTFANNTKNYIALVQNDFEGLGAEVTWPKQSVPYLFNDVNGLIIGYFNTPGGLTLEAGTTLLFSAGSSIIIGDNSDKTGFLRINGTAANPVTIGGLEPIKGYWQGIFVNTSSVKNIWNYANIADGGSKGATGASNSKANVVVDDGRLSINNCTSNNSQGCGYTKSSQGVITGTQTGTSNTSNNSCAF